MTKLDALLICPRCKASELTQSGSTQSNDLLLSCQKCRAKYPLTQGLLPFFADQKLAHIQWHSKYVRFVAQIQQKIARAESSAREVDILPQTKARLSQVSQSLHAHINDIDNLLKKIGLEQSLDANLNQLFKQRIASSQHVLSYYKNIFRDWAWDFANSQENENSLALNIVLAAWPKGTDASTLPLTVLGSGAGRLSIDLAELLQIKNLLLIDINPILLKISAEMAHAQNQELKLTELNDFPLTPDAIAKEWQLKPANKNKIKSTDITYLWSDGINLPLRKDSETILFTPWFIDIIPEDFAIFARRMNTRLKTGCYWVNFGPLGFGNPENKKTYTEKEIHQILRESGFEIEYCSQQQIPYLNSPLSAQKRFETVSAWRVRKVKVTKEPADFNYYPSWMNNFDEVIPLLPAFQSQTIKSQFEAQLLSAIDGQLTINQFVQSLMTNSKLTRDGAENLLLTFFSIWYETDQN